MTCSESQYEAEPSFRDLLKDYYVEDGDPPPRVFGVSPVAPGRVLAGGALGAEPESGITEEAVIRDANSRASTERFVSI